MYVWSDNSQQNALIFEDPTTSSIHRYEEYIPSIGGYNSSTVRSALPRKGFPEPEPRKGFPESEPDPNTNYNDDDGKGDGEDGKGGHACVFRWRKESPFAREVRAGEGGGEGEGPSSLPLSFIAEPQPESDFHSHGPKAGSGPGTLDSHEDEDDEEEEEGEEEGMETYSEGDADEGGEGEEAEGELVMEDHVDYATSGVQDIILAGEVGLLSLCLSCFYTSPLSLLVHRSLTLFIHPSPRSLAHILSCSLWPCRPARSETRLAILGL